MFVVKYDINLPKIEALPKKIERYAVLVRDIYLDTILSSIKDTIKEYLQFTVSHGYKYNYTNSLVKSFNITHKYNFKHSNTFHAIGIISSTHPAAKILETGGVIRPRSKKFLTIPLSSASQYGFSIEDQRRLLSSGNLFRIGNKLYVNIAGAKIPLFILKSSVRIPPYHYITRAIRRAKHANIPLT